MSVFIAPGVEGGLISAGITWFSLKGKQIGDQSLPKDDKRGTMKNELLMKRRWVEGGGGFNRSISDLGRF